MKKFFTGYIKSVNWSVTLFFYVIVIFLLTFDDLTVNKFLAATGVFFVMTLAVYLNSKVYEQSDKG